MLPEELVRVLAQDRMREAARQRLHNEARALHRPGKPAPSGSQPGRPSLRSLVMGAFRVTSQS